MILLGDCSDGENGMSEALMRQELRSVGRAEMCCQQAISERRGICFVD